MTIWVTHLLGPSRKTKQKLQNFESGIEQVGNARQPLAIKYYLIAILFVLFDVEIIFFYPYAVNFKELGWYGFTAILTFVGYQGEGFMTMQLSKVVGLARKNSIWPLPFATSCCGIEFMATMASTYDLARFGSERLAFTPRQ
ncbi:unnamed protein product, partial [Darwinula stevensoni]